MSYNKKHKTSQCDRCLKNVGIQNLRPLPFLFKDMNDEVHTDMGDGYRQYYVCDDCLEAQKRMMKK